MLDFRLNEPGLIEILNSEAMQGELRRIGDFIAFKADALARSPGGHLVRAEKERLARAFAPERGRKRARVGVVFVTTQSNLAMVGEASLRSLTTALGSVSE